MAEKKNVRIRLFKDNSRIVTLHGPDAITFITECLAGVCADTGIY